jgi:hypothetical protein
MKSVPIRPVDAIAVTDQDPVRTLGRSGVGQRLKSVRSVASRQRSALSRGTHHRNGADGCSAMILIQPSPPAPTRESRLTAGQVRVRAGGGPMRFYNRQHPYYCGIDWHVKTMYVCMLDGAGQVLVHRHVSATPIAFLEIVTPYRTGLVVAAECMFTVLAGGRVRGRSPPPWRSAATGLRLPVGHAVHARPSPSALASGAEARRAPGPPRESRRRRRALPRSQCAQAPRASTWP